MTTHPVNSTYYRCCRSLGGHSQHCPDGSTAVFAAAAVNDHDTTISLHGAGHRAACNTCGWRSVVFLFENDAREAMAGHYVADDNAERVAAMQRHPAGRARRHQTTISAAGGQLHAGCSGCAWTFTSSTGREVVEEASGHVEAAQVLGALGVIR